LDERQYTLLAEVDDKKFHRGSVGLMTEDNAATYFRNIVLDMIDN